MLPGLLLCVVSLASTSARAVRRTSGSSSVNLPFTKILRRFLCFLYAEITRKFFRLGLERIMEDHSRLSLVWWWSKYVMTGIIWGLSGSCLLGSGE